jgi:beta-glucosidase
MEARINAILARMPVEEKVGQIIQPDISSITPADVAKYKFGSILAGGNSAPGGKENAPPAEWLKLADAYWNASHAADWKGERIPLMWGIDAVHGHANVVGATIFPQNIGLGATRNPELIRRIGEVTAREMVVTGIDWDFSPTLAVVRDDRWGRTYEGFSEDPEVVRSYAGRMVEGLQGRAGTRDFMGAGRVIATAKHFVGDGGTVNGKDQGDNPSPPAELRDIHGAGYPPAIRSGVQAVMASFSSVRGEKVHGSRTLLNDALKLQMGFDGLVVGDWNAHGQVPGCTNTSCPASINAGLDMFMAPDSWMGLYENTLAQVRSGAIPMARLDDAVRRILRVKLRAGLFNKGAPSARPLAGRFQLLGAPEHRAVARQAVRESLVLLKNNGGLLPLKPSANVLVAGDGADNIGKQSGGWTITWQGNGATNADFPGATSIYGGIQQAVRQAAGTATLSPDGSFTQRPDAAIVVFGEEPYAEFVGDRPNLEYSPADKKDLELLRKLKAADVGQSGDERIGCLRRGLSAGKRRRGRFRRPVSRWCRPRPPRFPGQAVLQLAASRRPGAAQPRAGGLRPAVRLRLRPDLPRPNRCAAARRGSAPAGGGRIRRRVLRPRPRPARVELRDFGWRPDPADRSSRAGGLHPRAVRRRG